MKRIFYSLGACALAFTLPTYAMAIDWNDLRKAEKISLSLTGKPLPDDLRADFLVEKKSLAEIADQLSRQGDFIEYFAQYWTKVLGLQNGIAPWKIRVESKGTDLRGLQRVTNQDRIGNIGDKWHLKKADEIDRIREQRDQGIAEIRMDPCRKNGVEIGSIFYWKRDFTATRFAKEAMEKGTITDQDQTLPVQPGTRDAWARMYEFLRLGEPNCDNPDIVEVTPWWDPKSNNSNARYSEGKYYAAKGVFDHCGKDKALSLCSMSRNAENDPYTQAVGRDISMEAGYLIAHTVAEDRPFAEILTSPDTIMTGVYGSFMTRAGKEFWSNFPGGGIEDSNHAIFKNADVLDGKRYRIKRGKVHAGVLTTPVYQMLTNGRRAKANKAYETFLCTKFEVPEGISPDPNDSNPDLTKRHYCDTCHKTLEPMAAFFNAWPTTGKTDYVYKADQNDKGRFNGEEGEGAAAFGKILTTSESFQSCSIQRAFEFVNGRKMNKTERENQIATYSEVLKSGNESLRGVILAMVLAPQFLQPKQEASR